MKINEIFFSIQGEGKLIGIPTVFIRATWCNLRCIWCDTTYAYTEGKEMNIDDVILAVNRYSTKFICITGGEPLIQKPAVIELIHKLIEANYHITIETNGSITINDLPRAERVMISMDIKCPSSGMADKMKWSNIELLEQTDQLKFVIADDEDYTYAKRVVRRYEPNCEIIFQPLHGALSGKNRMSLRELANRILSDSIQVRALPQLHKLIWGNNIRGK